MFTVSKRVVDRQSILYRTTLGSTQGGEIFCHNNTRGFFVGETINLWELPNKVCFVCEDMTTSTVLEYWCFEVNNAYVPINVKIFHRDKVESILSYSGIVSFIKDNAYPNYDLDTEYYPVSWCIIASIASEEFGWDYNDMLSFLAEEDELNEQQPIISSHIDGARVFKSEDVGMELCSVTYADPPWAEYTDNAPTGVIYETSWGREVECCGRSLTDSSLTEVIIAGDYGSVPELITHIHKVSYLKATNKRDCDYEDVSWVDDVYNNLPDALRDITVKFLKLERIPKPVLEMYFTKFAGNSIPIANARMTRVDDSILVTEFNSNIMAFCVWLQRIPVKAYAFGFDIRPDVRTGEHGSFSDCQFERYDAIDSSKIVYCIRKACALLINWNDTSMKKIWVVKNAFDELYLHITCNDGRGELKYYIDLTLLNSLTQELAFNG